jgi:hypothetical protein
MSQDPKETQAESESSSRRYGLFGVSAYPAKSGLDAKKRASMVRWLDTVIVLVVAALAALLIFGARSGGLTVNFDSQGGSAAASQSVKYGGRVQEPEDVVRPGYVLRGWSQSLDGSPLWDFDADTVTEGLTLYAVWAEE